GSSAVADGQYGSIRLQTGNRQHGAGGMLTMQRGKFSFSLNANGGYMLQNGQEYESTITGTGFNSRTTSAMDMKAPMFMGDASLSYEIDSLNLISATAGGMFFGMDQKGTGAAWTLLPGEKDYTRLYQGTLGMKQPFNNFHVDVDWQHNFASYPGRMLTLSYRLNGSPATVSSYNTYDPADAMPSRKMDGRTNSSDHTFQGDLTFPISEKAGTLSTGVKFIYRNNISSQDVSLMTYPSTEYQYDLGASTNYKYTNSIGAAYAEYSGTFGKWGIKAGGRYEHTWQDIYYNYSKGTDPDVSINYGSFVPSASLQYTIGATQNIGMSYNMRISRPGITYLNPYVEQSDPNHWNLGNPDLDVEKTHNFSLVYNLYSQKFMLNATLFHNRNGNGIAQYNYTENDVLKTTYRNILQSQNTGLNLFFNVNIGKKARLYSNAEIQYTDMRNDQLGLKNYGWHGEIFAGSQQTIWWDLQLSEGIFSHTRDYELQGWNSGFTGCFAAITKSFLDDRLSLSLQGFTHLMGGKKVKFEMYSADADFETRTIIRVPVNQINLSLSWTFGKAGVSVKKTTRTITNDDVIEHSSGTSSASGMGSGSGMGM
ncbi:MAG: TonB-dependent receptor family protein, partial [Bacteroidales bacterium]|nr:TonB-dependent receptor family protein [Bacteroidales bacterium]